MTKDDIIKLAREAGPLISTPFDVWCERFANLVAAHKAEIITAEAYRCGYEAGVVGERKRIVNLLMIQHEAAKGAHNYWHVAAQLIQADVASDT